MIEGEGKNKKMFVSPACKTRREIEVDPSREGARLEFLESKLPSYGILLRASSVNALFIGVKKSRFFKSTLRCKALALRGAYDTSFIS